MTANLINRRIGLAIAGCVLLVGLAQAAPPVAEVQDQPSLHHGLSVPDPYRWLEEVKSPRAQSWMLAQGDATRALLDRVDQRSDILARLTALSTSGDTVRDIKRMPGDRVYYLKRAAGDKQIKLVMRHG